MTEIIIFGRGGQGGVTLAKLIATSYLLNGKSVQAFGVYAAERSGAPLQAFVRIDDRDITNHNQIREPDHVIVLDRTLISPQIMAGLKQEGWIVLNTPNDPDSFSEMFHGRRVATVDGTSIALSNGLGTRTVPIVNTTLLGAVAKVFDLELSDAEAALAEVKFGGANVTSARQAFEAVRMKHLGGPTAAPPPAPQKPPIRGILDEEVEEKLWIRTGPWAAHRPDRHTLTPPCNHNCPAGNDVRGFIEAVGNEDYDRAMEIILQTSPLPSICGRVCPAPCMETCNRADYDEAINVRDLERYVGDHARWPKVKEPWRQERVAVVGSGPAGLSTVHHLTRLGYPVTLFEVDRELGGVMRTGIPSYRLPRKVLDREINRILECGVTVKTERRVSKSDLLGFSHEFAAVFVATGLQEARSLDLGGAASGVVSQGIDFLDRARKGCESMTGQHVVVIGGGNTAMDSARTARRLGALSVRVVYRRTRTEMPAIKEEIEEALEENIILDELVSPVRLREDGVGLLLTCNRMRLGEPDESGRRRPIPETSEDAFFDIRCDRVILALDQSHDLSILPEGSEIHENGNLLGLSGAPVFAGGDFATNDGTVSAAIGSGRRAAWHIHRTLTGQDLFPPPEPPVASPQDLTMHVFRHARRQQGEVVPPGTRRHSFVEVRRGLADDLERHPAVEEAERCFSCGVCNSCDRCMTYCPEGILLRDGDDYRFDYDYCKGCGICASQCPRGVVYMAEL